VKIDVNKIDVGRFAIRDEMDEEYLGQLAQSLLDDGQWHPIIVRRVEGGRYELVAGHYRLNASVKAGLKEIEANIRELSDEEADLLSLKTNMIRQELTPREQGRALSRMMERYGWSQSEIARKLSVESKWVGRRLRVALELHEEVAKALDNGRINFSVASVIGSMPLEKQPLLLNIVLKRGVTDISEAGAIRRQLLNDTIFTIGCEDRDIDNFIDALKQEDIELLMDVRYSSDYQHDPDFSGNVLKRELERNDIEYEHRPEYGIPHIIQDPYKEGALSHQCLKQWYEWHVNTETKFGEFIEHLKKSGKVALMGIEKYAKPTKEQKYSCHRDILADLILDQKSSDPLMKFGKRKDL